MDPLPSTNKVYSMVIQEESNNIAPHPHVSTDDSSILVNASDARKPFTRGKSSFGASQINNNYWYCTFFHRNNHNVEYCYQKHGYPNANKHISSSNIVAYENVVDSHTSSEGSSTISQTGLTQEQYVHLVSLLHQSSLVPSASASNPASTNHITSFPTSIDSHSGINIVISCSLHVQTNHWIIDSGANEHICSSLSSLHSYYKIKPLNVTLPNGSSVLVDYAGTIIFSPHFHFSHVLYSLSFQVNLISVSKIYKSLYYQINFLADKCVIQDVKTQKMIGLGSLYDGLYRLQSSPYDSPLQAHYVSSIVNPCN